MQDLSQLYRFIQKWETEPQRACMMLRRRCIMLAPLVEQLNPQHFQHFVRNLSYECGETMQELYEIKARSVQSKFGPISIELPMHCCHTAFLKSGAKQAPPSCGSGL